MTFRVPYQIYVDYLHLLEYEFHDGKPDLSYQRRFNQRHELEPDQMTDGILEVELDIDVLCDDDKPVMVETFIEKPFLDILNLKPALQYQPDMEFALCDKKSSNPEDFIDLALNGQKQLLQLIPDWWGQLKQFLGINGMSAYFYYSTELQLKSASKTTNGSDILIEYDFQKMSNSQMNYKKMDVTKLQLYGFG